MTLTLKTILWTKAGTWLYFTRNDDELIFNQSYSGTDKRAIRRLK